MGRYRRKKRHNTSNRQLIDDSIKSDRDSDGPVGNERGGEANGHNGDENQIGERRVVDGGSPETLRKYRPSDFTSIDRDKITSYLRRYRDGSQEACFGSGLDIDEKMENTEWFCGHEFPALTVELLSKPYIELPSSLHGKHRKIIHQLCADAELFHSGAGSERSQRRLVVSAHLDGLDYVPDMAPTVEFPVLRCKPWFYRNDHCDVKQPDAEHDKRDDKPSPTHSSQIFSPYSKSRRTVKTESKEGKELIEEFLDQPGRCLRNGLDSIDFKQVEFSDLSEISPPGAVDWTGRSSWMLIDSSEKMNVFLKELQDNYPSELGFDLEMYNESKYCQITCLLQLSTNHGKDYVIDVLAPGVWDMVSSLQPIFADSKVVKVGHSIDSMDIPSLHRDFGIFVVNAFDTYQAAQVLELKKNLGLAKLCDYYGLKNSEAYMELKKEFQRTDWRVRPLSESMVKYGLHDSHYLIKLRELMIRDLTKYDLWDRKISKKDEGQLVAEALAATMKLAEDFEIVDSNLIVDEDADDMNPNLERNKSIDTLSSNNDGFYTPEDSRSLADEDGVTVEEGEEEIDVDRKSLFYAKDLRMCGKLMTVITKSQQCCLSLYKDKNESPIKNDTLVSVLRRSSLGEIKWENANMTLYCKLVVWRDEVAKNEGILPSMVCPLDLLVNVSLKQPVNLTQLRCLSYYLPGLLSPNLNYAEKMLSIVQETKISTGTNKDFVARKYPKYMMDIFKKNEASQNDSISNQSDAGNEIPSEQMAICTEETLAQQMSSRISTLKWTAVGAAAIAFWIGSSRPKR